jgi:glycosyltransferase involved in cell wall biosynthesis
MQKIKILLMIDQPFLGGGQINLLSLAKNLDKERFEIFVCSGEKGPLVDEVRKNNLTYFPVTFSKKLNKKTVKDLVPILGANKIDILHTHGGIAGFYGRWAARKCRVPVIIHTLHGIHYLHYRNFLLRWIYVLLERYFSRFTDALIFVSDADREKGKRFKLAPEEKMVVVKNGIDLSSLELQKELVSEIEKNRRDLGLERSQPIVGTVARLHRQKGIAYLLKAAERIYRVFPEIKILIVGGGPLRSKLEREAGSLGLEDVVRFMGERKDVTKFLSIFDVFVLPSLWEGLPYVLMEAAALGKAVVATDIDGVREVIENGKTGILVPPRNPESLAHAVRRLLQDKDYALKLGQKLEEQILPRFTLSRMVAQTQSLYLRLYENIEA